MLNGKSFKGFPMKWCENTVLAEDSYREYARPNSGLVWGNERFVFDIRWMVLCDAHINVEVAQGVHAVKYRTKHVHKRSGRATLALQNQNDDTTMNVQARYIGLHKLCGGYSIIPPTKRNWL